ncbi:MAG: tetratricopeptide repeat protein [Thermodesulfobacteriota bacterium]|nr:tetratricopeptide repeat protein [Thermodesulfobacteriota bacterium]
MKSKSGIYLPIVFFSIFILVGLAPPAHVRADEKADRVKALLEQGWAFEGQMHVDLANLDKAIAVHKEALALAPDNDEAMWRLAEVIFKKSEAVTDKKERKAMVERTVLLAEQALAVNPTSVGGMYWAGTAHARLADMSGLFSAAGQVKQAKVCLHRAIDTDPNHRLAVLSGVILAKIYSESPWPIKDMEQALNLARWAVAKDPNLTLAGLTLGRILLAKNETAAARTELNRCLTTEHPTYVWDAVLYDWPEAKTVLAGIK